MLLTHDEIKIVKDFDHYLLKKRQKTFDSGDFRKIISILGFLY